jgi:acyl-CoA dehydrogenase
MSEFRLQFVETADRLLAGDGNAAVFESAGFDGLLSELGGDWGDVVAVCARVGYHQPGLEIIPLMTGSNMLDNALASVALASGSLARCLEMAIDHANTRIQFGKPLSKQQAVQQSLAIMAQEVAIVAVAAQAAGVARDKGEAEFEIGAAKLRTNKAIGIGTAIAHQVHGAIGFTQDYPLHRYTQALIRWRSLYGNDAYWAGRIGKTALGWGGQGLWPAITAASDP